MFAWLAKSFPRRGISLSNNHRCDSIPAASASENERKKRGKDFGVVNIHVREVSWFRGWWEK